MWMLSREVLGWAPAKHSWSPSRPVCNWCYSLAVLLSSAAGCLHAAGMGTRAREGAPHAASSCLCSGRLPGGCCTPRAPPPQACPRKDTTQKLATSSPFLRIRSPRQGWEPRVDTWICDSCKCQKSLCINCVSPTTGDRHPSKARRQASALGLSCSCHRRSRPCERGARRVPARLLLKTARATVCPSRAMLIKVIIKMNSSLNTIQGN